MRLLEFLSPIMRAKGCFGRSVLTALFALNACTVEYPAPSQTIRDRVTQVEIAVRPAPVIVPPDRPVSGMGKGALAGAGFGLGGAGMAGLYVLGATCSTGIPIFCATGAVIGVAMLPVGAAAGALVGAATAPPDDKVVAADRWYKAGTASIEMQQRLSNCLARSATRVAAKAIRPEDEGLELRPRARPIDGRLDIEVLSMRLERKGSSDPTVHLDMIVLGRLLTMPDGTEIYWRKWQYRGTTRGYFDFGGRLDRRFDNELTSACANLANKIIDDLFIAGSREKGGPGWDGTRPEIRTIEAMEVEE